MTNTKNENQPLAAPVVGWFSFGLVPWERNRGIGAFVGWETGDWRPCIIVLLGKWTAMVGPHIQRKANANLSGGTSAQKDGSREGDL